MDLLLNDVLNKIHVWSNPDQNPMKRMFLTRFAEMGCVGLEASLIAIKTMELGALIAKNLTHPLHTPQSSAFYPLLALESIGKVHEIATLIKGFASTIFFGVIFSPEANFKIHLSLRLVSDDLAEKTQKERTAKLQTECQKAEMNKLRNERLAKLESEQKAGKETEVQSEVVKLHLAELLFA